jgi:hypothetical protein
MSSNDAVPTLLAVDSIDLHNPSTETDETLKRIDFEGFNGSNILNHDVVVRRINNGWIPRGFEAKVEYKSIKYTIVVAGNENMGYAKVEHIGNVPKAKELQSKLRERFLEYFRLND